MSVKVDAVCVGGLRPIALPGREPVETGIAKKPAPGPVRLTRAGFVSDRQGDTRIHGGPEKAVHHYPRERYAAWASWVTHAYGGTEGGIVERLAAGRPAVFGENLSTVGVTEEDVCVGDVWQLGTAVLQVSQARQPCWKLDARLGVRGTARHMQDLRATGWYYRVLTEGVVSPGDTLTLMGRSEPEWPLSRLLDALFDRTTAPEVWREAASIPTLAESWRRTLSARVEHGRVEDWSRRLGAT